MPTSTATTRGRLDSAQAAVLAALAPGGTLTAESVTRTASLTSRRARHALAQLSAHGLIWKVYGARYVINYRGLSALGPSCHA